MALRALLTFARWGSRGSAALLLIALYTFAHAQEQNQDAATASYTAVVISQNAEVRSGPGREYYATQPIREGARVEVFGAQSGWLAIRPPEGSFSWLRSADVLSSGDSQRSTTLDANTYERGKVRRNGVISQVGSQLTQDRDVWQVELKQDEEIFILGYERFGENSSNQNSRTDNSTRQDWVKIAPPAGEFRWIRETDVRRAATGDETFRVGGSSASRTEWSGRTVAQELETINLKLTDAVSYSAGVEELAELAERAAAALERAQNATEHGLAEQLSERIDTFLDLAQRQDRMARARAPIDRRAGTVAPGRLDVEDQSVAALANRSGGPQTNSTTGGTTPPSAEAEPRFDAMGILTPVNSGNSSVPQYALLDEAGKLRYYLTAAPGMRLQTFEGRYIGVTGNRGFSPELNARHVTARQVHALDTPIRRE